MTIGTQLKSSVAALKGTQGTLRQYSVQSQSDEARAAFSETLETVGEIVTELENRLSTLEIQEPQYKGF